MKQFDLELSDGDTLHVYDKGPTGSEDELVVFWHHGTPNIGAPPEPLFETAERLGLRWVSYDRPGYGGSTRRSGRNLATAAAYVSTVANALGIGSFALVGHSGGGCHALACAASLPERVLAVVSGAGLAPYGVPGLDWFAGMADSGVSSLRAAAAGREEKERLEASGAEYDPEFTEADLATLQGDWSWLGTVVGPALESGTGGLVDDDIAYTSPWGTDLEGLIAPTLLLHGGRDRVVPAAHSEWLARHCPSAELHLYPEDGHISVLEQMSWALGWLREKAVSNRR